MTRIAGRKRRELASSGRRVEIGVQIGQSAMRNELAVARGDLLEWHAPRPDSFKQRGEGTRQGQFDLLSCHEAIGLVVFACDLARNEGVAASASACTPLAQPFGMGHVGCAREEPRSKSNSLATGLAPAVRPLAPPWTSKAGDVVDVA